ncbi:MAG TPA: class I SAM-dependent methyltransferase [Acidobacteriota bacterium]
MFGNWINIHDLERLGEKIARGEWRQVARKLRSDARGKTRAAWEHTQDAPIHAWDIPALRRRWNKLVSGDEAVDHVAYIAGRYLQGRRGLKAFSPGCGGGGNEIRWAGTGIFERIDACDLSVPRIAGAIAMAEREHLSAVVTFSIGGMMDMTGKELYDMVIVEGALHHFFPMRAALIRIRELLKPGGLLVVNDFVGPSRFQWTPRQLQAANAMLALIPEAYKGRWPDGKVKKNISAPGRLRMKLADPSEAAESSLILPLLAETFTPLALMNKGGAIACLVFFGIAHHYIHGGETAERILQLCFDLEDLLMQSGDIASDYILGVYQKPGS